MDHQALRPSAAVRQHACGRPLTSPAEGAIEDTGDEYSNLLRFVDEEAKRAKRGGDDGEDDGLTKKRVRKWYAPWSVDEYTVDKNGEVVQGKKTVPSSWLETDMQQGLSDSDVTTRRGDFGYNELESAHENMFLKFLRFVESAMQADLQATSSVPCSTPWSSPSSSLPVSETGSTLVSSCVKSRSAELTHADRHPHPQRLRRMVPGEAGRRHCRSAQGRHLASRRRHPRRQGVRD